MRKTVIICDHTGQEGATSIAKSMGRDEEGIDSWDELDIHPAELKRRIYNFINRNGENKAGEELWKYLCEGRKTTPKDKVVEGIE